MEGQNLKVKVQRLSQRSIEFDLVGVDASIANAFRRIMIAEVCLILYCLYSGLIDLRFRLSAQNMCMCGTTQA